MNKTLKYSLIGLVVILAVCLAIVMNQGSKSIGVAVSPIAGVCNGTEPTTQICNLNSYNHSVQGLFDVAGTTTLNTLVASSTDLGNGAAVTITGTTSTLKIGDNTSGIAPGCLVLGSSGGATSSPVYITATGTTITATTTKPAICF
jgi:hypothetical protein